MDLRLSPEHEALRQEVRRFLAEHASEAPPAGLGVAGGMPEPRRIAWQRTLIEHGYAARTVPREYGGYGAEPDPLALAIIDEEFSRAGVSRGIGGQGPDMLVPTLLEFGTEKQKRRYIPPTIRGEMIWCQGYSEPGAGSDLASVSTRGEDAGDAFLVTGQKIWTTGAHQAHMMFALVRTEPEAPRHAGLSYLLIPMDAPGIEVRPLRTMTGHAEFNEVFLDRVRVPMENLVGRRGQGWQVANATLAHERNFLSASGQIEAGFERLRRLMERETLDGIPAIRHPIYRDRLLRLQGRVLAQKAHGMRMLSCRMRKESPGVAGLVQKLVGCELAHQIAALGVDVLGERGMMPRGLPEEEADGRWPFTYFFSLGLIIGGGTAQIQKNIISERGLGMPREPRGGGGR